MTILGPAEKFKTMNWFDPIVTLIDSSFLGKHKR